MAENTLLGEIGGIKGAKALLYTNQDNTITVDRLIQQAANKDPSSFHVWYAWGVINKLQDDLKGAEQNLRNAIRINPMNIAAQHELARVLTFRGQFTKANLIFHRILTSDLPLSPDQKIDILLHAADNYIYWANRDFKKKLYKEWINRTEHAFNIILFTINMAPSNRRVHELHKKICLDFAHRLIKLGKRKEAEKHLLRVIATVSYRNKAIPTNSVALSIAYSFLAKFEKEKSSPSLKKLRYYAENGLEVSKDKESIKLFNNCLNFVKNEETRVVGKVKQFHKARKFGIITNKRKSFIFFPKFLTWYCNDFSSLIGQKVSFIPLPHSTANRKNSFKAVSIKLVKEKPLN